MTLSRHPHLSHRTLRVRALPALAVTLAVLCGVLASTLAVPSSAEAAAAPTYPDCTGLLGQTLAAQAGRPCTGPRVWVGVEPGHSYTLLDARTVIRRGHKTAYRVFRTPLEVEGHQGFPYEAPDGSEQVSPDRYAVVVPWPQYGASSNRLVHDELAVVDDTTGRVVNNPSGWPNEPLAHWSLWSKRAAGDVQLKRLGRNAVRVSLSVMSDAGISELVLRESCNRRPQDDCERDWYAQQLQRSPSRTPEARATFTLGGEELPAFAEGYWHRLSLFAPLHARVKVISLGRRDADGAPYRLLTRRQRVGVTGLRPDQTDTSFLVRRNGHQLQVLHHAPKVSVAVPYKRVLDTFARVRRRGDTVRYVLEAADATTKRGSKWPDSSCCAQREVQAPLLRTTYYRDGSSALIFGWLSSPLLVGPLWTEETRVERLYAVLVRDGEVMAGSRRLLHERVVFARR